MRISDWSSDVCSSDLVHFANLPASFFLFFTNKPPQIVTGVDIISNAALSLFGRNRPSTAEDAPSARPSANTNHSSVRLLTVSLNHSGLLKSMGPDPRPQ